MEHCIETIDLVKTFDTKTAVDHLNLRVDRGSFYGFLGPNGAGKSTTIRMLTGLTAPTSGSIELLGRDFGKDALAVKQRIGVVPEDLCIFESLTAAEYLTFIGRMYGMEDDTIQQRAAELLDIMELRSETKTLTAEYSTGMRKKLSLAAALIHDPELLFLDEPFEGVDAVASRTIRAVLDKVRARGATIFLTSHILEIVQRLCTDVGIISRGQLVRQGPMAEVTAGASLEDIFVATVGVTEAAPRSLSWLEGAPR